MANPSQLSDPDLNLQFARDWGAGKFHARLAAEAARWLAAKRKARGRGFQSRNAKIRVWRAAL